MVDAGAYRVHPLIDKEAKKRIKDFVKNMMKDEIFETNGLRPDGLSEETPVEVKYVTDRWVSGLPKEHQWDRITHYKNN